MGIAKAQESAPHLLTSQGPSTYHPTSGGRVTPSKSGINQSVGVDDATVRIPLREVPRPFELTMTITEHEKGKVRCPRRYVTRGRVEVVYGVVLDAGDEGDAATTERRRLDTSA
jgi:hypothetical protein